MNKLLSSMPCHGLMLLIALLISVHVNAQDKPPIRQADFIVAVVNSEPVTNREVLTMRSRLLQDLAGRGGQFE